MAERLTRNDVDRIAALAHLELTNAEAELFTRQLADILTYAERLQEVDTRNTPATWHPSESECPRRPDVVRQSLKRDETLLNAPDAIATPGQKSGGFFRVPRVID